MREYEPVEGYKHLKLRTAWNTYYIVRKVDGRVQRTSLGTSVLDEAIEQYMELYGKPVPEQRNVRVRDAWDTYIESDGLKAKTRKRYRTAWNTWVAGQPMTSLPVHRVQPRDVIQVLERARKAKSRRTGEPLSESSLRNIYVAMSAFFKSCTEEPTRYRFDNPVNFIGKKFRPAMPVPKELGDAQFLSDEEIDRIAAEVMTRTPRNEPERIAQAQRRVIVLLSPEIGTRIAETLGLQVLDYKRLVRPHGALHVVRQISDDRSSRDPRTWFETLKGNRGTVGDQKRVVALSPFAQRVLGEYVDLGISEGWLRPEGLLFPSSKQTPRDPGEVGAMISAAAEQAGIPHRVVSHYFRHTWASRALETIQSDDVFQLIGETLGHHPEVARTRYAHRSERASVAHNARIASIGRQ